MTEQLMQQEKLAAVGAAGERRRARAEQPARERDGVRATPARRSGRRAARPRRDRRDQPGSQARGEDRLQPAHVRAPASAGAHDRRSESRRAGHARAAPLRAAHRRRSRSSCASIPICRSRGPTRSSSSRSCSTSSRTPSTRCRTGPANSASSSTTARARETNSSSRVADNGSGHLAGTSVAHLQSVLHDEAGRRRHGTRALDLGRDRARARRPNSRGVAPGRGATFVIEMPHASPPASDADRWRRARRRRSPVRSGCSSSTTSRRSVTAVATFFRSLGHVVDVAATAREGLSRARSATYDAMLLDLRLPDIDRRRDARRARGRVCAPPAASSSSPATRRATARARRLGATGCAGGQQAVPARRTGRGRPRGGPRREALSCAHDRRFKSTTR